MIYLKDANNGLLFKFTDKAGQITTTSYTPYNEVEQVSIIANGVDLKQNYTYDSATRLLTNLKQVAVTQVTGATDTQQIDYHYDAWKRLDQQKVANRSYTIGYDAYDRRTQLTYPGNQTVTYTYDELNRMKTAAYPGMGTVSMTYGLVSDTNTTTVTHQWGQRIKQTKAFGELKTVTAPGWSESLFGYDGFGNINHVTRNGTSLDFTYDGLNRISTETLPSGQNSYTYDNRGNRLTLQSSSWPWFPDGEQDFKYNPIHELTNFDNHAGTSATYSYYGDGLRATKTVNGNFTRYVYLDGKVIEELDSLGNVKARNIWGNELLWRLDNTTSQSGYYEYNGHGDVVKIVNSSGGVINSYDYDIWGNITSKSEGMNNPFKYTGEIYDDETGFYYLRARYYDPTIGRFIQQDTVEGDLNNPLTLNLYTYVQNNPLRYTDPSGYSVENAAFDQNQYDYLTNLASGSNGDAVWAQGQLAANMYYTDPNESGAVYSLSQVDRGVREDYASEGIVVAGLTLGMVSAPALFSAAISTSDVAAMGTTTSSLTGGTVVAAKSAGLLSKAWNGLKNIFGTKAVPEYGNMLNKAVGTNDLVVGAYEDGKVTKVFLQNADLGGAGHKSFLEGGEVGFYVIRDPASGRVIARGSGTASITGGRYATEAELQRITDLFGGN